jgi:hypothetical protein
MVKELVHILLNSENNFTNEERVKAAETLALLSYSQQGRFALIQNDAMRELIALSDRQTHFWLEITICNMHIADAEYGYAADLLGDLTPYLRFDSQTDPFASSDVNCKTWLALPMAIFPMSQNIRTFVKIAKSIGSPLVEGSADDITNLPQEYDDKLVKWCVSCYSLLTQDSSSSRNAQSAVVETKSHPYNSSEHYGGVVEFPGAIRLQLQWDAQCRTENNYDYLMLWKDVERSDQGKIMGKGDSGKWTGTAREGWEDVEVESDRISWDWYSDGSNNEWGFRFTVTPVFPNFGDSDRVRSDMVVNGGVDALLDFTTHADQNMRKLAAKALTQLSVNERARREIDKRSGMEPLLALIRNLRFKVTRTEGLPRTIESSPSSSSLGDIPQGTVFTVTCREWYSGDEADPNHVSESGYFRMQVLEPNEYKGWVSNKIDDQFTVHQVGLDKETLRLLALLSLEKRNRQRLIEVGKLRTLLRFIELKDPVCDRVVALALDELAVDKSSTAISEAENLKREFQMSKASSVFDIMFDNKQTVPQLYASNSLERVSCERFSVKLPMYEDRPVPGMYVCRGPHWAEQSTDASQTTRKLGLVKAFERGLITVLWNDDPDRAEHTYQYRPDV